MNEPQLQTALCQKLKAAMLAPSILRELALSDTQNEPINLYDLVGDQPFEVVEDTTDWEPNRKGWPAGFLMDVSGGVVPDLILRSKKSRQNRIVIEVKVDAGMNYTRNSPAASQIVRYLLHLLVTTLEKDGSDIRRAVLLAAPSAWIEKNTEVWNSFLKLKPLAKQFDITLGALRIEGV
jgi:hypothetical protein